MAGSQPHARRTSVAEISETTRIRARIPIRRRRTAECALVTLGELSRDVAHALDELAQTTSEFSCGSARSSLAVSVISDNMQRLRDQLEGLSVSSGSLREASAQTAESAGASADLLEQLSVESARGLDVLGPLIDAIRQISDRVVRVHELVETLAANELASIEEFSAIIHRIASQTKLLALNAAIEAARHRGARARLCRRRR